MERAKLIVKNFGPLKDIEIEVREMVTFIGAQASGKSTLAKLLSIFEDENFRRDERIEFEDELKKYNIFSYLRKDTIINYDNYKNKNISINSFDYKDGISTKFGSLNWLNKIKKDLKSNEKIDILKDFINFDLSFLISTKVEYIKKFANHFNLDDKRWQT
ncbi:MAG: ATP-binding protein [Flavobacterium sp.]|nr:ATP-binding protein [Flavobacterium sp.]